MKRFALTLITLCCVARLTAEPVGRQAALFTAQSYLLSKGKNISAAQKPFRARGKAISQTEDGADAYYYVFNSNGGDGYVIVSGDDRTEPILGYVEHGTFQPDSIPENMRSWLQLYADQIKYIVDSNLPATSPLLKRRSRVQATKHSVPELLTTRWDQGHPYNICCPKYYREDGTQDYPATGCTATAMAQVINFYRFPDQTKAIIPALTNTYTLGDGTTKSVTAKAIPRGTVIDWENMRNTYSWEDGHTANAQDSAVANLMLCCGQAVKMGYGASSGANFSAEAYVKYFGYDDSAFVGERGNYTIDEWFDMLYGEIAQGYPVLFSGFSSAAGHAFVLDGFDGDNLFHLNWGWSGGSNGWFLIGILNPGDNSGIGASSSSDGYSMGQRALFNLRLPDKIKADPTTALTINDVSIVNETSIRGNWINWTGSSGNFNAGIVKLNDDGTVSLVGTPQSLTSLGVNYYQTKTFALKGKLPEGTYRLSPASKLSTAKTWRPKYNMQREYIEAVVDAAGTPRLRIVSPTENISIEKVEFPGTRIVGTQQEVKVTFRNDGDEYFREVFFFASRTDNKVYTESRSMVAVRKGETVEVSFFFTPTEEGTYNLWFCTDEYGNGEVGHAFVNILNAADATMANLRVTSYTITNSVSGTVYGKRLTGRIAVRNNAATDFHGNIRLQIWRLRDGDQWAYPGETQMAELDIAAGKTATANFSFEDLQEGYTYYMPVYYVGQEGELAGAGLWDHSWKVNQGIISWKADGSLTASTRRTSIAVASNVCGFLADCASITRLTPNKNPNTIYAFAEGMTLPTDVLASNAVSAGHAAHINLVNDRPFYAPITFEADTASFTYTFPESEQGTGWHTFTMPFDADSARIGTEIISLDDTLKHFWIYEFAAQGDSGEVIFAPARTLRANLPYIIAADSTMAGRSVTFRSTSVRFYKTGADKMRVGSQWYKFQGTTLTPKVDECYVLNAEGTAFEYTSVTTTIGALSSYFTTSLPEEQRPQSIVLPEVPHIDVPKLKGDANNDGATDIADVVSVLNIMAASGYTTDADVNNDSTVDIADVVSILNIMAQ